MTSADIRQSFLDFFASHGHTIVPSSSLLPDSPGLLFTNAGMNQFVPIFLGDRRPDVSKWAGTRPAMDTRAADTQKCIRAGGKHNDLEDVGFDTYHHTMFEMLGNWSFGDYFKKESLTRGWELLTRVWGIPPKRLFASVYQPDKARGDPSEFDQEAYDIWAGIFRPAGLDPEVHIVYGGKKDNFWMMGDTGPCGPCSEIHINLSPADDEQAGRALVNAGKPRCIEIWNHVFIQFNANADGTFSPLAARHVDTGMGFERVAGIHAVTRGFADFTPEPSNYAADVFAGLFARIETLSGKRYAGTVPAKHEGLGEQENIDVAFRVLADHARCVSCAIADGILPSNDGRNYVVRRILRRGIMYGKKLGLKAGFFEALVEPVVQSLGGVFPELKERQDIICRVIHAEEESFGRTIDRGLTLFEAGIARLPGSARVSRAAYGVPPDAPQDVRYTKRRLPHFERPWGKYHISFSTANRVALSPAARQIVLDSLIHGHVTGRYYLYAACVMPDHVHVLLEPQAKETTPDGNTVFHALAQILHSIKSFTAHEINKAISGSGPVWEKESYDRLIRSESDLQEKFLYIVDNPQRAGLVGPEEKYPFLWTPDSTELRRDAEASPRDAGAPINTELRRDAEASPRDAGAPKEIPGTIAFELYDTYGFPLDMTQLLAAERGLTVDVKGFNAEMEKQRERGRAAQKKEIIVAATEGQDTTEQQPTKFLGYTQLTAEAKVIDAVKADKDVYLVFDQTPFYAEMGGQAGDHGAAEIGGQVFAIVYTAVDKAGRHLHKLAPACALDAAKLNLIGQTAQLVVSPMARRAIARHHTTAHLIHWALRKVLGTHVHQAGTSKTKDRLRFDFSHFEQVKPEQLRQIERLVNEKVLDNAKVDTYEVEFDKKPADTLAFFGEKYGATVRVVDIGGYSRELCGGTHVSTTGEIGLVKIVAEMAIAAGTRRIEVVAGQAALDLVEEHESELHAAAARLHTNPGEVDKRLEALLAQNAELEKQLMAARQKEAASLANTLAARAVLKDGLKFVSAVVSVESPEALRNLGSQVLAKLGDGVVQLGAAFGEKATVVAFCSPAAIKAGLQAGKLVSELSAKLGGKGGGKPDFAMGGGKEPAKLADVLKA
jgi:alanyl-tRNA synthetase/REP element-mobilizing transposase RayT